MKALTTKDFIEKAEEKHSKLYGYSKTKYINDKIKIIITCSKHGDFEQRASSHLSGTGCNQCRIDSKKTVSTESFIQRANAVHNNKYIYSKTKYKSGNDKITVTCKDHGDFQQSPFSHLQGKGCSACTGTRKLTTESFIKKAKEIHKGKYTYAKTKYKGVKEKVIVTCSEHGDFLQSPNDHLQSCGCPECAVLLRGWTKTIFKDLCNKNNEGLGILYILRCFNEEEEFYKIGITSDSVKRRYDSKGKMPYEYEIIKELELDPIKIYNLENKILRSLKSYQYKPKIYFGGETECFSKIESTANTINSINKLLN